MLRAMKTPFAYGAGMAFAGAVVTLALHLFGLSNHPEHLLAAIVIALPSALAITVAGIILGTRQVRQERGAAGFSYGQAFRAGFLIVLSGAALGTLFNFCYYQFLFPDFAEVRIEWTRGLMERMGARAGDIERALADMRTKATLGRELVTGLIFSIALGSVVSLITAAVMKRPPPDDFLVEPPSLT